MSPSEGENLQKTLKRLSDLKEVEVVDLGGIAAQFRLEETELMHWIFELGQADGLVQTIKEKSGDTESVVSEIPWQGEVLQVNSKVLSIWPTEKVRFLFRGPGGLGVQLVDGGWSLEEWFMGLRWVGGC